jgi:large conductance mechanosensitive channel
MISLCLGIVGEEYTISIAVTPILGLSFSGFPITSRGGAVVLKEFRDFAVRGNVIDLAVAVIMGAAFGPIVTSLVTDIIMPPIGLILGEVDFKDLFLNLRGGPYPSLAAAKEAAAPVIAYGNFLNTVINFLIVAFAVFLLVRQVNRFKKPAPPAVPNTKDCPFCFSSVPLKAVRCAFCTSELRAG